MTPIFVISIPTSSRRPAMQKRMDEAGLRFEWWDAIDGRESDPRSIRVLGGGATYNEARARLANHGAALRGSEVALSETTFQLYRHCLTEGLKRVAILEDDAILQPHFADALAQTVAVNLDGIVKLYHPDHRPRPTLTRTILPVIQRYRRARHQSNASQPDETIAVECDDFSINTSIHTMDSAVGYAITARAMKKLLRLAYPIRFPIDEYMKRRELHGVHSWHVVPRCVSIDPRNIPSEIRGDTLPVGLREVAWPKRGQTSRDDLIVIKCLRYCCMHVCRFVGRQVVSPSRRVHQFLHNLVHLRRYL